MSEVSDLAFSLSDDAIAERAEVLRLRSVLDDLIKAAEPFLNVMPLHYSYELVALELPGSPVIKADSFRSLSESVRKAREAVGNGG